jgi:hypothetical protein
VSTYRSHNSRLAGVILALMMVVMMTASGGAWRCLDGTLCPTGPMRTPAKALAIVAPRSVAAEHACCAPVVHNATGPLSVGAAGMQCVFSQTDRPAASVERGTASVSASAVELPAPIVLRAPPAGRVAVAPAFTIPPPPILNARFGRAPPSIA